MKKKFKNIMMNSLENTLDLDLIERLKKKAQEMEAEGFEGKGLGNKHLDRVLKISLHLADKLEKKGIKVNKEVVGIASVLHDIGLSKSINKPGGEDVVKDYLTSEGIRSAKIAEELLRKEKVREDIIREVLKCIQSHEGNKEAETIEAKIIYDADALDKMGALGIIRHTWKLANLGLPTEKIAGTLVKHIKERESKLYLKESKKIAKKLNKMLDRFDQLLKKQLSLEYLNEE